MTTLTNDFAPSVLGFFTAPFRAVAMFLISLSEAQRLSQEAEALLSMSDKELATVGLQRDEIPAYLSRSFGHI